MRPVLKRSLLGLLGALGVAALACSPFENPDASSTSTTTTTTSGVAGMCGWDPHNDYYECGYVTESPTTTFVRMCPEGLVAGEGCGQLASEGCCDAESDLWYCGEGDSKDKLVEVPCE